MTATAVIRNLQRSAVPGTALAAALLTAPLAGQDFEAVEIKTIKAAEGVYMLVGAGGNIGVSVGSDGVFMIDDQFAPLTAKIEAAVRTISDQPIRFVVNTHWHRDHTGGNENLGKVGAILVSHENVRRRMSTTQFLEAFQTTVQPAPEGALPQITFTDEMTFHWNDDEIQIFHVPGAHTDGDSIIRFTKKNVVHMGDTFFNGMYPFIDASSGGSIEGMIDAAERVLEFADGDSRIIPGHGELGGVDDLRRYRDMLRTVAGRLRPLIDAGRTRQQIIAARPTEDLDETWGGGFMKPDQWVGIVYDGMK